MSKTIDFPSGETSSEIHVASSVVNRSVRTGLDRKREARVVRDGGGLLRCGRSLERQECAERER